MKALYLSRLDNNIGDIQSSVYNFREILNREVAKRLDVASYELFPEGDVRDFALPDSWASGIDRVPCGIGSNYDLVVVGGGGLLDRQYLMPDGMRYLMLMYQSCFGVLGIIFTSDVGPACLTKDLLSQTHQ